jgi:hypothetical protein
MYKPITARAMAITLLMAGACPGAKAQGNSAKLFKSGPASLRKQADSVKSRFLANGYTLLQEIPVTMKSEDDVPVIVNLKQGDWYQVVFIGDSHSQSSEIRMYDYDENEVVYKRNEVDKDGNIIAYSYVPRGSEFHLIRPIQHAENHQRVLNGWFVLMQKPAISNPTASEQP